MCDNHMTVCNSGTSLFLVMIFFLIFRTFTDTMSSLLPSKKWTTKLSSAGLVYCHFGRDIISSILGTSLEDHVTETIYDKVYEHFVEEIDAIDNGVNQFDGEPR